MCTLWISNATNLSHIDGISKKSISNTLVEAILPSPCVLVYKRLDDNKFFMKVSELWALEGPPKQSRSFCRVWSRSIVKFKLKDFRCVLYGCPMRPTLVTSTVWTIIRGWKQFRYYLASPSYVYFLRSLSLKRGWKQSWLYFASPFKNFSVYKLCNTRVMALLHLPCVHFTYAHRFTWSS